MIMSYLSGYWQSAVTHFKELNYIIVAVIIFGVLAISEQIANGLLSTKFVIKDLMDIFTYIFTQLSTKYGLDSLLNTPIPSLTKTSTQVNPTTATMHTAPPANNTVIPNNNISS